MKVRFFFSFALLLLSWNVFAQSVQFDKVSHDFEELYAFSDRFVDITLTNTSAKRAFVLSVKKPAEVVYLFSGKEMQPDSSVVLRFQVNPLEKGKFKYELEVFTSDRMEPVRIVLKGEMEDELVRNNNLQSCPTFGQRKPGSDPLAFDMTIVVIDKTTQRPLPKASVSLIQNGRAIGTFKSNKDGKIEENLRIGYSYFYAQRDGYQTEELGGYINFQRNYLVIEMEPKEEPIVAVVEEPQELEDELEPEVDSALIIEIEEEPVEEPLVLEETTVELPPELANLDPNDFSSDLFDPVNVVFVVDVSSSMRNDSKMDLMKYSLVTLVDMLRPQDRLALVAYGSKSEVVLPATSGSNKSQIIDEVEKMKAGGMTAGGAGIKMGFREARKALIADGVNQVIIITDGAFNKDSKDYKRAIRRYKRYGITMSVVGVKNKEPDAEKMKAAAELGRGVYIPIFKLADAQNNLKQEIRKASFKY